MRELEPTPAGRSTDLKGISARVLLAVTEVVTGNVGTMARPLPLAPARFGSLRVVIRRRPGSPSRPG